MQVTRELPNDLVKYSEAAKRLGISRATVLNRVRDLGLRTYLSPMDRRVRLVSWGQLEAAMRPRLRVVLAASSAMAASLSLETQQLNGRHELGLQLEVVPVDSALDRAYMLRRRLIDSFAGDALEVERVIRGEEDLDPTRAGPFAIRDYYPTLAAEAAGGFLIRRSSELLGPLDLRPGARIAEVSAVPRMRQLTQALLAWAQLGLNEAAVIPAASWGEAIGAVTDGSADVTFAMPEQVKTAGISHSSELAWLDLNPAATERDRLGARSFYQILPQLQLLQVEVGSVRFWGVSRPGTRFGRFVNADADARTIHQLTKLRSEYEHSLLASPALERLVAALTSFSIPLHEGTVAYLRERGLWGGSEQRRQERNLQVLGSYIAAWAAAEAQARAVGLMVDGSDAEWRRLWAAQRATLPPLGSSVGDHRAYGE